MNQDPLEGVPLLEAKSSNIAKISTTLPLVVVFSNGSAYRYPDVTHDEQQAFLAEANSSPGKFFAKHFRARKAERLK